MIDIDLSLWDWKKPIIEVNGKSIVVGREKICEEMERSAKYGGSVLITALGGYGKTTMLLWAKEFVYKNKFTIMLRSKDKIRDIFSYYYIITRNLIHEVEKNRHKFNFSDETLTYIKGIKPYFRERKKYSTFFFEEVYERLMEYFEKDDVPFPIYVFMDDANYFAEPSSEMSYFRDFFKSLTSEDDRIFFVVTMQPYSLDWILNHDKSVYDRFTYHHTLPPLEKDMRLELIRKRLEVSRKTTGSGDFYPFTDEAVEYLVEQSDGVPRNIIRIVRLLVESAIANNKESIDLSFTIAKLREANMDSFSIVSKNLSPLQKEIINFLERSGGCGSLKEMRDYFGKSHTILWRALQNLIDEKLFIVKKKRGYYCLSENYTNEKYIKE